MNGIITATEEFLFPDSPLEVLPKEIHIASPRNGMRGIQLLVQSKQSAVKVSIEGEGFAFEINRMQAVIVDYNTGDGVSQGGAMVITPDQKPDYAIRKAPFYVYDCLVPCSEGVIQTTGGSAAAYITLKPLEGTAAGVYKLILTVDEKDDAYSCEITFKVHDVRIPDDTFPVTHWFGFDSMERFHHVQRNQPEFLPILKKYIVAMRRMHQTIFFMELAPRDCVVSKDPYTFDFEHHTAVIQAFFDEGMQKMEIGTLITRGDRSDGMPDMYTHQFTCTVAPDVFFETEEGYGICVNYLKALAAYLKKHGWQDRVLFHIHDEPDVHVKDQSTIQDRRRQYYMAASMVRKYLPGVEIIEAVSSAQFYGGIDIWVPGTAGYEQDKAQFDKYIALGEKVWNYVCCGPQGKWLNRFMDLPLIKGRLLFWGFAKNKIGGYLHWGFNRFPQNMDPWVSTSCPNRTGLGTSFPCGDSFIILPGDDGPWLTMRAEACRRGVEDVMLLQCLREQDENTHDQLVEKIFRTNTDYTEDPIYFEAIYEELLRLLEKQEG